MWPGFDHRPIRRDDLRADYEFLPPKFFDILIEKLKQLIDEGEVRRTRRDE